MTIQNIIGHGGQGTIRDQDVAIKKCKIFDESKKKEFGKEMLILLQLATKTLLNS